MIRYLIAALAGCLILIYGGWKQIQSQAKDLATATDLVTTLNKAADSRRNTQRLIAQFDTDQTKALTDAQNTIKQLRADVASGARRLSVPAKCPVVRATTTAAGLDDAETRAELDPAAAERIIAIPADGDEAIHALTGLQDYVTKFCLGSGS
ncbi:lysis system i-spanin subunit Rz [Pseudomonas sp. K5002]|uniref:lysis system i-spanin subunit Rz n=1 Tax=Pseudomonas sp. K5002 TaxID=2738828 RepID=UPI0015B86961|nr:lysis system i-spanin subunit Rz [Pseudomonas sp. K5002]NWD85695.1 lysis protein [Pseudomonas sp. K5002]